MFHVIHFSVNLFTRYGNSHINNKKKKKKHSKTQQYIYIVESKIVVNREYNNKA
jgi:hypothetical protein